MKDYEYFIENLETLYTEYGHRFLVIKNEGVIADYDSFKTAYDETIKTEALGTFIIQECVDDPTKLIHHFQFNVKFTNKVSA